MLGITFLYDNEGYIRSGHDTDPCCCPMSNTLPKTEHPRARRLVRGGGEVGKAIHSAGQHVAYNVVAALCLGLTLVRNVPKPSSPWCRCIHMVMENSDMSVATGWLRSAPVCPHTHLSIASHDLPRTRTAKAKAQ